MKNWPDGLHPDTIALSFDVEWAGPAAIADTRVLLDERGIRATFFVTHAGVDAGDHERGIHPNFRRNGDVYRSLPDAGARSDEAVDEHVVTTTLSFAPEAKGVRAHSLRFDSTLLPLYQRLGLEYDASLRSELVEGLRPFWKQHGIVEIPAYYADYFDLVTGATGFALSGLHLDRPGLKVFDFHPNLIYANIPDAAAYAAMKAYYSDEERLLANRFEGRGARTLLVELLDAIAERNLPAAALGEINRSWRSLPAKW